MILLFLEQDDALEPDELIDAVPSLEDATLAVLSAPEPPQDRYFVALDTVTDNTFVWTRGGWEQSNV